MQRINPDGTGDIFDDLLAHILEWVGQLVADVIPHRPRNADPAGLSKGFQVCRDVYTVTEDVVFLHDHIANIDADAEYDAPLVRNLGLAIDHRPLDLDGATHRINDAREFRQHTVAGVLDDATVMLL